ncbi:hypothetical protein ACLMJK_006407 [Lecanora helva]
MSFGFSIGDCLTALLFVKEIVTSLSESHGSAAELRELLKELSNLQHALDIIKHLPDDGLRQDSIRAIQQTATDCQAVLDKYAKDLDKYRRSLGYDQSNGKIKDAFRKLQWPWLMKKDVQALRNHIATYMAIMNAQIGLESLSGTISLSEQIQTNQHEAQETVDNLCSALSDRLVLQPTTRQDIGALTNADPLADLFHHKLKM